MNSGFIYIVATPIGNLGDITARAVETLKSVDAILCEDTRVTSKLMAHLGIQKTLISYHHHSDAKKISEIKNLLKDGKNLALVTDAGTPGISDPGNELVKHLTTSEINTPVVPIPGPSAVVTALSISGFPTEKFTFLGFPPHKNKRQKFFKELAVLTHTAVFYESPHRILKCLKELQENLSPQKEVVICRELTKKFESVYRGTVSQLFDNKVEEKGEFVIVVG